MATEDDFDLVTSWANDYIFNKPVSVDEEGNTYASILLNGNVQPNISNKGQLTNSEEASANLSTISEEGKAIESPDEDLVTNQLMFPTMSDLNTITCRRTKRKPKPSILAKESTNKIVKTIFSLFIACTAVFASSIVTTATALTTYVDSLNCAVLHSQRVNTHFDGILNTIHHVVLTAVAGDNDAYTLKDVFKQDDKSDFIQSMLKEVEDHEQRNHWTVLPKSEVPKGTKTIMSIWPFKRKRYPDGRVLKHKARLCVHGGMQKWGENYW